MTRRPRAVVVALLLASLLFGKISNAADKEVREKPEDLNCSVYIEMEKARENAETVAKETGKIVLSEALERKIGLMLLRLVGEKGFERKPEHEQMKILMERFKGEFSLTESVEFGVWYAARTRRAQADDELDRLLKKYGRLIKAKDKVLDAAEKTFEAEQAWLEEEKKALKSMSIDDAYYDRVSKILDRLKKAYAQMQADLGKYNDCSPDVRLFLQDKADRLKRIDLLEKEIRERRGTPPVTVVAGEPPPPGPLGDEYVCEKPEISPVRAKLTRVDINGFSYKKKNAEGKEITGGIRITKAPPERIRVNQRVEIIMVAEGEALVDGAWQADNVVGGQIPHDNGCSNIPEFKRDRDTGRVSTTANARFYFGPRENAFIKMYGGEYDARDGTRMEIVWKYTKVPKQPQPAD